MVKRLMLTALAAITVLGPMAAANAADAKDHGRHNGWDHQDRWRDRHDDRRDDRWDDHRHNGYYYGSRWYYGPPPAAYYGRPDFRLGYTPWARGGYLPPAYRQGYVIYDYGHYGLRRPPYGYAWRRVGDDYVLAALATGLILEVLSHR